MTLTTRVEPFTHPRLVEVAAYLAETRQEVLRAADEVPDTQWAISTGEGSWSAAQIIDHLRVVEHGVVRLFEKVVPEARAADHPAEVESGSVLDPALIARMVDRGRRLEAPARVQPTGAPDRAAGLAAIAAERDALLRAMRPADGLALGTLEWTHPAIGPLDLYRWLVFVGAHELRHAAQLRELAQRAARR